MSAVEITEVIRFLKATMPFQLLPGPDIRSAAAAIRVKYVQANRLVDMEGTLSVIRKGAFEIRSPENQLVDRIADGECFGVSTVLENNPEQLSILALEDSLIYQVERDTFQRLATQHEDFKAFFTQTRNNRLRKLAASQSSMNATPVMHLSSPVSQLMATNVISVQPNDSVQQAAQKMKLHRVSSILVVEAEQLVGILTDRDIRTRVVAEGLTPQVAVASVMTQSPKQLDTDALLFNAQLMMSENNVHHLPVVDDQQKPIGMITSTDLLRSQQLSPHLLVSEINRSNELEHFRALQPRIAKLLNNLIAVDMTPYDIGQVLAVISDAVTKRLIELAQSKLGKAPMPFAWLVFGSQGRKDQSLGSDQDNALLLQRTPSETEAQYFSELSEFVCQGLDAVGFVFCPGDIMASNPSWRKTQQQWQDTFSQWILSPTPKALLNASIFFDIRKVWGCDIKPLTDHLAELAKDNQIFLATMAQNAANKSTPIGFFRDFVVERSGEHKDQLDLKHQGLALVNDIARVYGLASGETHIQTLARLNAAHQQGLLAQEDFQNLADTWELLSELKLQAQQASWNQSGESSAFLNPSHLSTLERRHLKSAFQVIDRAQDAIKLKFSRQMG